MPIFSLWSISLLIPGCWLLFSKSLISWPSPLTPGFSSFSKPFISFWSPLMPVFSLWSISLLIPGWSWLLKSFSLFSLDISVSPGLSFSFSISCSFVSSLLLLWSPAIFLLAFSFSSDVSLIFCSLSCVDWSPSNWSDLLWLPATSYLLKSVGSKDELPFGDLLSLNGLILLLDPPSFVPPVILL